MLAWIEHGWAQAEIAEAGYAYQRQVETGARPVVGVNCFAEEESAPINLHRPRAEVIRAQVERLHTLRQERDNAQVKRTLKTLEDEARDNGNLMYPILEAVRAYATIGEICAVLRGVFGEHSPGMET
jgi:methylmalonyl-CoA mutase N-terminal domain/subunit